VTGLSKGCARLERIEEGLLGTMPNKTGEQVRSRWYGQLQVLVCQY